mgnify:CR=1 FL=1|jgi:hypothetical protein|tara:strand:+ start:206 stop:397 length:192 start_codon:yes stop_codon:yes gene_type:complete
MNIISLDFSSVVIGYTIGIALMWSIHTLLFEEDGFDETAEKYNESVRNSPYSWNYPYDSSTSN